MVGTRDSGVSAAERVYLLGLFIPRNFLYIAPLLGHAPHGGWFVYVPVKAAPIQVLKKPVSPLRHRWRLKHLVRKALILLPIFNYAARRYSCS